jgi:glycine/D-amino acid oxidase-like deaminating enzyme
MTLHHDFIVLGGGVVGAAIAFHLLKAGAGSVALVERQQIASGCTARSSAIIRTHYSIPSNSALAWRTLEILADFRHWLDDAEAESGYRAAGYLILGGEQDRAAIEHNVAAQQALGIDTGLLARDALTALHPQLHVEDVAVAAYEPRSGWADPYLVTSSFYRAARRRGLQAYLGDQVRALLRVGDRVTGVELTDGRRLSGGHVISALNVWSTPLLSAIGVELPLHAERHLLASFRTGRPYGPDLPVVKDLLSDNKLYFRPDSGGVVLTGGGELGDRVDDPDHYDENVGLDYVVEQGQRLAHRLPAYAEAEYVREWCGLYDVTPDWNPVAGSPEGLAGLTLACGFSGHGFKLAPALGEALAACLTGGVPCVDLVPYAPARFARGALLHGAYGCGSIS